MSPMSEYDSAVFSEGHLATALDRKDGKNQHGNEETSFQSGKLLYTQRIA